METPTRAKLYLYIFLCLNTKMVGFCTEKSRLVQGWSRCLKKAALAVNSIPLLTCHDLLTISPSLFKLVVSSTAPGSDSLRIVLIKDLKTWFGWQRLVFTNVLQIPWHICRCWLHIAWKTPPAHRWPPCWVVASPYRIQAAQRCHPVFQCRLPRDRLFFIL